MKAEFGPREQIRLRLAEYDAFEDSIQIVKEKRAGTDVVLAVTFEGRDGNRRHGIVGFREDDWGAWRPSGSFIGRKRTTGDEDLWMTWGGWGPGTGTAGELEEKAVVGGWVAESDASSARLVDPTGRVVLEDSVVDGVVVFMWEGEPTLDCLRLELLDADRRILKAGPVRERHKAQRPQPNVRTRPH
ncbi:MAG: hypothetical protein M3P83_11390 [Actinomycetota bacterium]|nr:hypothetical protein [Actinomycetota bacterium]